MNWPNWAIVPVEAARHRPLHLAADFGCLAKGVEAVDAAGADWIHVDVMDGCFVPNITAERRECVASGGCGGERARCGIGRI